MKDYPSTPSSPSPPLPSPSPILIPTTEQNQNSRSSTPTSGLRTPPLISQTFGFPRNVGVSATMLPSSNEFYTTTTRGGGLPSALYGMNSPGASGRVPLWAPAPSPNSLTRQLGFGPRRDLVGGGSGLGIGGGSGSSVLGMEQMRREYGLGYKAYQSPTQQVGSPISDGSPLSYLDLDTDLLGSPQTGDETLSPAQVTESIGNNRAGGGGDTPEGANRGRRVKRSRSSLRSKNRQKHNEAEMRRRRKLNESFEELAQVCGSAQAQKATVLKTAIFQIQSMEKHIYVSKMRLQALKRLSAEDPLLQKRELLKEELAIYEEKKMQEDILTQQTRDYKVPEPCVKKEEPATPSLADLDIKHTQEDTFRPVNIAPPTPSLPEVKKELDLQAQLGLAWKDIQDLVEYKKRTSQIISNVLQLAQLHINHQSIFASSIVFEVLCAMDGKIIDCNTAFCNLFGYTKEQATQLTCYAITHPDSLAATYHIIQSLLSGSTQITQANHKLKTADGRTVACQVTFWVAITEGRDPYLRMILEPAPVAPQRSSPRSRSPRRLASTSGARLSGRRLNSNPAILGATPNSASPLLRVRMQKAAENAALLSGSSNSATNLNSRLILESPGLRVRQLARASDSSSQMLLDTPATPSSQYDSKESSSRGAGDNELPGGTTSLPFLSQESSVATPSTPSTPSEPQLPPSSPSDTTS